MCLLSRIMSQIGNSHETSCFALCLLSSTRWNAQHDAIELVFSKFPTFIKPLEILCDNSETFETRESAENLIIAICEFYFLCYLSLWKQVSKELDDTQKDLQINGMSFRKCVIRMQTLKIFVNENRSSCGQFELQKLNLDLKSPFDEFSKQDVYLPKEILWFRRHLETAGIKTQSANEWICGIQLLIFSPKFDSSF